jgi:DNA-binding CsgD family transcriptional regulator
VLSIRTVENHRATIYRKTGARSRAELVAYVHRL